LRGLIFHVDASNAMHIKPAGLILGRYGFCAYRDVSVVGWQQQWESGQSIHRM